MNRSLSCFNVFCWKKIAGKTEHMSPPHPTPNHWHHTHPLSGARTDGSLALVNEGHPSWLKRFIPTAFHTSHFSLSYASTSVPPRYFWPLLSTNDRNFSSTVTFLSRGNKSSIYELVMQRQMKRPSRGGIAHVLAGRLPLSPVLRRVGFWRWQEMEREFPQRLELCILAVLSYLRNTRYARNKERCFILKGKKYVWKVLIFNG